MFHRLKYYFLFLKGALDYRNLSYRYSIIYPINKLTVNVGLYKPSSFLLQHTLLAASLSGRGPTIVYQSHGKRQRRTVMARTTLIKDLIWYPIDKLVHEIFPILVDYRTPKFQKKYETQTYSLRLRNAFVSYDDFDDLITLGMYESYRGIFMPMSIHLKFININSHLFNENYIRLLRFPISLSKRYARPAFDDPIRLSK